MNPNHRASDTLPETLEMGQEVAWDPVRLVSPNPWVGHLPFAFWLIKVLRPRMLVELGTHSGNSFAAFCQAVTALETDTSAFAVDTWQGDAHAGYYGDEVFANLRGFVDAHYAGFATLLRGTFDEARGYFGDGEIDLLHIDGLHTYDAVRHDFETWRPTLSSRAVVVLHDINVRERDFGVWRLWRELSQSHPSFAFDHAHGLGVLGIGAELPPALRLLLDGEPEIAWRVRCLFAARGAVLRHRLSAKEDAARLQDLQGQVHRQAEELAERQASGEREAALAKAVEARDAIIRLRDRLLHFRDTEIETLNAVLLQRAAHAAITQRALVQAREHAAALIQSRAQAEGAIVAAGQTVTELRAALAAAQALPRDPLSRALRLAKRVARRRLLRRSLVPPPVPEIALQPPAPPAPAPPMPVAAPEPDAKAAMRSLLRARLAAFMDSSARLTLPSSATPAVSIVLVLYNQAELTFGCLTSIAATLGGSPVETIVFDNGSSDETAALLDRIDGATIIRHPENLHFLRGVNRAVRHASSKYLLLLNNDAQLQPGAVAAAIAAIERAPDIGAVGARIIRPDGSLQEAGSIVWNDGTCVGYGRGRAPSDPEFMFCRDVDYCSGAFPLTPRATWHELGGFDEAFTPAYYEETDYCLRLWESGRRVVYEPEATIVHYEFGSADADAQALDLQQRNWQRFAERHAEWLRLQYAVGDTNQWLARTARRLPGRPPLRRVLMIEDRIPRPELGAGYPRSHRILAELVEGGAQVTLFPTFYHPETWDGVRRAVGAGVEVIICAQGEQMSPFLQSRRGQFDAVLVCRPHNMAHFLDGVGSDRGLIGHAKVIYDAEAVFTRRAAMQAALKGEPIAHHDLIDHLAGEMTLTRLADLVVSVSEAEREVFHRHGTQAVRLLGHVVEEKADPAPFSERTDIMFVGALTSDQEPNADSLHWFAHDVLPRLRALLEAPKLRLRVVGRVTAPSILALDGDAVDLVGQVADLAPHFARGRVMVVPTRFAAGLPHKAHQAAAFGVPMVATRLIAEQLGWTPDVDLLAADDPDAFARACARLFSDAALWQTVRDHALARCREECSPAGFREAVQDLLDEVPVTDRTALPQPAATAAPAVYVGRDAAQDFSAAVPFAYAPTPPAEAPSIAVFAHIYHAELAAEMRNYLGNIPVPADLYLTTDTEEKRAALLRRFEDWRGGTVLVAVTPNRGRDVAPKLIAFPKMYEEHDLVLHVHSKRSLHDPRLLPWRGFLFETLLGSPEIVCSVLDAFARLPRIGMIAPQHLEFIRHWLDWGGNFAAAQALATRMDIPLLPGRTLDFPSGSMFWARSAALRPLLGLKLRERDFPPESGQEDGTPAHAIERLYFRVCERAGYDWMKIARREFFLDDGAVVDIEQPEALVRFASRHVIRLYATEPPPHAPVAPDVPDGTPAGLLDVARAERDSSLRRSGSPTTAVTP